MRSPYSSSPCHPTVRLAPVLHTPALVSQSPFPLTGLLMPCRIRLPKGLDLENPGPPPDPDRWLPKWQRSDFTKKKRNRQQRREKVGPTAAQPVHGGHGVRFPK